MTCEAIQVSSIRKRNTTIEDSRCGSNAQQQKGNEQPYENDDGTDDGNVLHEYQDVSDFHDQVFPPSS
jgi:hypothetical protein